MRVVNVGEIGNTYDCPTPNCPGETTDPAKLCIGCESRSTAHRLPLVDAVIRRRLSADPVVHGTLGTQALSPAELEVMRFLADGFRDREIADRRGCSRSTVNTILRRVYNKLGVHNRSLAVAECFRRGLLE